MRTAKEPVGCRVARGNRYESANRAMMRTWCSMTLTLQMCLLSGCDRDANFLLNAAGVIEPLDSPWLFLIGLIKKKDNSRTVSVWITGS